MNNVITVMPKILGTLFYYSPDSKHVEQLKVLLPQLSELFFWQDPVAIQQQSDRLINAMSDQLTYQFSLLFEGQGEMLAPPWGSAYLDKENLLMGESTLNYRQFLAANKLLTDTGINEPDDQFGLMLLAFALLLEQQNEAAAIELIEQHLLPWAPRYLTLVIQAEQSPFYAALAHIALAYLQQLQQQLGLNPPALKLYK